MLATAFSNPADIILDISMEESIRRQNTLSDNILIKNELRDHQTKSISPVDIDLYKDSGRHTASSGFISW